MEKNIFINIYKNGNIFNKIKIKITILKIKQKNNFNKLKNN